MKVKNGILSMAAGATLFAAGYMATERFAPKVSMTCQEDSKGQWVSGGAGPAEAATYIEACDAGETYLSESSLAKGILVANLMLSAVTGVSTATYLEVRVNQIGEQNDTE